MTQNRQSTVWRKASAFVEFGLHGDESVLDGLIDRQPSLRDRDRNVPMNWEIEEAAPQGTPRM